MPKVETRREVYERISLRRGECHDSRQPPAAYFGRFYRIAGLEDERTRQVRSRGVEGDVDEDGQQKRASEHGPDVTLPKATGKRITRCLNLAGRAGDRRARHASQSVQPAQAEETQ